MRIKVYQDKSQAIAAGENTCGDRELEIDISTLTEAQRYMLSQKLWHSGDSLSMGKHSINPAGVVEVLDEMLVVQAHDEQAERDRHERAVADLLAMPQDEINTATYWDHNSQEALDDPRLAEKKALRRSYLAEQERLAEANRARHEAEYQRMLPIVQGMIERHDYEGLNTSTTGDAPVSRPDWYDWGYRCKGGDKLDDIIDPAMKEIKARRKKAEISDWIAAHGSERLRLAHAKEYKCRGLYINERLALELGEGWVYRSSGYDFEDCINPTLTALETLEALPQGYTGVIIWMKEPLEGGTDEDFEGYEAIKVDANWLGEYAFKQVG